MSAASACPTRCRSSDSTRSRSCSPLIELVSVSHRTRELGRTAAQLRLEHLGGRRRLPGGRPAFDAPGYGRPTGPTPVSDGTARIPVDLLSYCRDIDTISSTLHVLVKSAKDDEGVNMSGSPAGAHTSSGGASLPLTDGPHRRAPRGSSHSLRPSVGCFLGATGSRQRGRAAAAGGDEGFDTIQIGIVISSLIFAAAIQRHDRRTSR